MRGVPLQSPSTPMGVVVVIESSSHVLLIDMKNPQPLSLILEG